MAVCCRLIDVTALSTIRGPLQCLASSCCVSPESGGEHGGRQITYSSYWQGLTSEALKAFAQKAAQILAGIFGHIFKWCQMVPNGSKKVFEMSPMVLKRLNMFQMIPNGPNDMHLSFCLLISK